MTRTEDFGGIELSESQYEQEWAEELDRIRAPDVSLGSIHVMALAQVLRRPVIVFAQPFVRGALGNGMHWRGVVPCDSMRLLCLALRMHTHVFCECSSV